MQIRFHRKFKKQYKKLPVSARQKFDSRLAIFIKTPFEQMLENHPLHGKYANCRSINVTGNIRAIYEETKKNDIFFITIGTHAELYE